MDMTESVPSSIESKLETSLYLEWLESMPWSIAWACGGAFGLVTSISSEMAGPGLADASEQE